MPQAVTISRKRPDNKSLQYDFLREEGIKHIQQLAGEIWTDHNAHDPGITILEALCYVITDLGYRISFPIQDILAQPLGDQSPIKNFYTARQILHNFPVTLHDYRKLIIDVAVADPFSAGCRYAGVKNAWLELTTLPEIPFFVHRAASKLDYSPDPAAPLPQQPLPLKILYTVLLEFDACDTYGDLNENILAGDLLLENPADPNLIGVTARIQVTLPRWDEAGIDWETVSSIRQAITAVSVTFFGLPDGYSLEAYFDLIQKNMVLSGSVATFPNPSPVTGLAAIETAVNDFIFDPTIPGLIYRYQQKVAKVRQILAAVKARLHANRKLCEDFIRYSALKIEEVLLCADIELQAEADVEEVQASIFFEIAKFLAPPVNFYSLEEMQAMDKETGKIYTPEELRDDALEKHLYTTEEIFDGPALQHGFIPGQELILSERRGVIHVSDLIRIIMAIPGVVAVKSIQIANRPQDNDAGIASKSVKWCLDLALEYNYVPRLHAEDSKITFYKDQLPFKANQLEVEKRIRELQTKERPQKLQDPVLDIALPRGEYKDLEDYVSVQNEFPLNYGIGPEGLPASVPALRKAQARQLKAFLLFFDQLFANFLSQMEHVKDLFSMNAEKDAFGQFRIGRTYYNQTLFDIVPDADDLYVDKGGHAAALDQISERPEVFEARRNRFLNHLMARFGEQFTDYALLAYKLSGPKAPAELIADKLAFLNAYPLLSAARGTAFNYLDPCQLWHIQNISGLERRAALLVGIDERLPESLEFTPAISITGTSGSFGFTVAASGVPLLQHVAAYPTQEAAKEVMERVIIKGQVKENYRIQPAPAGQFYFDLWCDTGLLASSARTDYTSGAAGGDADLAIQDLRQVLTREFYQNPEANRKNLACPLSNYFESTITLEMIASPPAADPPRYTIGYTLYGKAFDFTPAQALLRGEYTGEGTPKEIHTILSADVPTRTFSVEGDIADKLPAGTPIIVTGSSANDGLYTVAAATFGLNDTFIVVNEAIPADLAPLGDLSYDVETEARLQAKAEAKRQQLFEEIVRFGAIRSQYSFDPGFAPYTSPYVFQLSNRFAEILATSVGADFNNGIAAEINALASDEVMARDAADQQQIHTVITALSDGPQVNIEVSPAPSAAAKELSFRQEFSFTVHQPERMFTVSQDLTAVLRAGQTIAIEGTLSNDGAYTIRKLSFDGMATHIFVAQPIPSDEETGRLTYTKSFPVVGILANAYLIKGGADEQAVADMMAFLNGKFSSHEGLHLVEHILLRPQVNEPLFAPATPASLNGTLLANGTLLYSQTLPVQSISRATRTLELAGEVAADFMPGTPIEVVEADLNNGEYTVVSAAFNAVTNLTALQVQENVAADMTATGLIRYQKNIPVTGIKADEMKITVSDASVLALAEDTLLRITSSQEGINDGRYTLKSVTDLAPAYDIAIKTKERQVTDDFLEINLDQDCAACQIEDPYTCIASVILPYWPARFTDANFRQFFEKTLRQEAPAHVFLKICWINCEQMADFEQKYKAWLAENAKTVKDKVQLSFTLSELIGILGRLRNVYPSGTLHDCEEDDTLENSIILNNSVLGNA